MRTYWKWIDGLCGDELLEAQARECLWRGARRVWMMRRQPNPKDRVIDALLAVASLGGVVAVVGTIDDFYWCEREIERAIMFDHAETLLGEVQCYILARCGHLEEER